MTKRSKSILEQAKKEERETNLEWLAELERDLLGVRQLVEDLRESGEAEFGRMHRRYLWARPPKAEEGASAGYRMRMLTLELWNKWRKLLLHLRKPGLGFLDGTNNATERVIGKSKVRYKTMRGYKSMDGMTNGIALTQWLYSGEDEHDLAKEMAAA